jgi:hypothetical protein
MNFNKKINQALDNKADKTDITPIIKFIGAIIYLTGLIYAGSHVFSFIGSIMSVDFLKIMGYIGGVGIVLNGAVLPLAIHSWTMERFHRFAALTYYVIDLVLIAGFVWANTNLVRNTGLLLADSWMEWISPLTFMNTILTWGTLAILDPENRMKYKVLVAQRQVEEIQVKAEAYKAIVMAEREAEKSLAASGINLDSEPEPTRTFTPPTRINSGREWQEQIARTGFTRPNPVTYTESQLYPENTDEFDPYSGSLTPGNNHSGNHSGTPPKV